MSTISVLITTYGTDDWRDLAFSRALPSVLEQGADEILVRHWPDLTIGPARNKTVSEAVSAHVICLDADDELDVGYVDAMRRALHSVPDPHMTLFQPAVRYIRKGVMANPILIPQKDLRVDNFLVVGTMVSRDLLLSVGGFGDYAHGFEDWAAWARCWKAGATIHPVSDAFYHAHINPKSAHRTLWRNRREQVAMHMRVQSELFPEGVQ